MSTLTIDSPTIVELAQRSTTRLRAFHLPEWEPVLMPYEVEILRTDVNLARTIYRNLRLQHGRDRARNIVVTLLEVGRDSRVIQ